MAVTRKGSRIEVVPSVCAEEGEKLFAYTEEVANNTAQIVRVNSSGPFPIHPLSPKKGWLERTREKIQLFLG